MTSGLEPATAPKPLEGVRILDLTRLLPGNVATLIFALLGADVIKVEDTGAGDYQRTFGAKINGSSISHLTFNRGKRSIALDLKQKSDRETFEALVRTSDVLIESFRPGVLERLGYSPEQLQQLQPRLVVTRISGFGNFGPLAQKAGHDINYMAFSGHLDRMGQADGPPAAPQVPFADIVGGALLPAMLTIAYVQRGRTHGIGAVIDSSMADSVALMPNTMITDLLAGETIGGRGHTELGGAWACYGTYKAADGYVVIGALEEKFWRVFCEIAGLGAEHHHGHLRPERQTALKELVSEFFQSRTRNEIADLFANVDACVSPVLSYEEMLATPHAKARRYLTSLPGIAAPVLEFPAMVDGTPLTVSRGAPAQGEHSAEIRAEAVALLQASK
jgi:alpha-methylacyl-CoA racemase